MQRSLSRANLMVRGHSKEEPLLTQGLKDSTPVPLVLFLVEVVDLLIATTDPPRGHVLEETCKAIVLLCPLSTVQLPSAKKTVETRGKVRRIILLIPKKGKFS